VGVWSFFYGPLRYDPGIMGIMPWAVGCLTRKNTLRCRAVFA
jgi:hypothetical protein